MLAAKRDGGGKLLFSLGTSGAAAVFNFHSFKGSAGETLSCRCLFHYSHVLGKAGQSLGNICYTSALQMRSSPHLEAGLINTSGQ